MITVRGVLVSYSEGGAGIMIPATPSLKDKGEDKDTPRLLLCTQVASRNLIL